MPSYICEKCGCVDNSACGGNYHIVLRKMRYYDEDYANTHFLCTECAPARSVVNCEGSWHNLFPKKHWSEYGTKEEILKINQNCNLDFTNAVDYFKNNKERNKNAL